MGRFLFIVYAVAVIGISTKIQTNPSSGSSGSYGRGYSSWGSSSSYGGGYSGGGHK